MANYTSSQSGNFSDDTTWGGGGHPVAGDTATIANTHTVTLTGAAAATTVTVNTGGVLAVVAQTLTVSGDITINGSATATTGTFSIGGSWTMAGTFTCGTGTITMTSTSTGKTFTAGGQTYNNITFNGTGGGWTLQDALTTNTTTAILTLTAGALYTNGQTVNIRSLTSNSGATTRTLDITNSTITCAGTGDNAWNLGSSPTGLTFVSTGSTINETGASPNFYPGGKTYNIVNLTGSGTTTLKSPASTFSTLNITGTTAQTDILSIVDNMTVNGAFTLTGNSATARLLVQSNTIGTARTITLGASATMASVSNYVDMQDILVTGGATNERDFQTNGKSAGDCGGNGTPGTNATFTTAAAQTFTNAAGGSWSTASNWTSRIPLPQDDVSLNRGGNYNSGITITSDMPRLGKSVDFSGMTWTGTAPTFTRNTNTIYGSLTLKSGVTYTANSAAWTFSGRGNYTMTSDGNSLNSGTGITLSAFGGTYTQTDAYLTTSGFTIDAGTWNSAGFSATVGGLVASSSSIAKGLTMGGSTWTMTGSGNACILGNNTTSLTLDISGGGTFALTYAGATATTFAGGPWTYPNIVITPGSGITTFSGAFTFANMSMASAGAKTVKFTKATTYKMSGTNFLEGTNGYPITINSSVADPTADADRFTLDYTGATYVSEDWLVIDGCIVDVATNWYAGANSTDGANNGATTWTFSAPPAGGVTLRLLGLLGCGT